MIERAQAMPKQGAVGGFKYGRAVGAIEAAIALCGIPVTIVEPSVWKRFHGISAARTRKADGSRPCSCFRPRTRLLARKKDHGRAEASLIALYGARIMNAPLEPAHSPFGGSVAARVLRCPASVGLIEKVPAHLRKSSAYAERGTALHAAMALLIERECVRSTTSSARRSTTTRSRSTTSRTRCGRLSPTWRRCSTRPAPNSTSNSASSFRPSPAPSAPPTCSSASAALIHVIDFKFGTGVRVLALYPDGDEDVINAQLLFYAAAARHSLPEFFAGVDDIVLTILQPLSIEPDAEMVSSVTVTHAELDEFIAVYRAACEEALSPAPRLERGAHCRFCPARPICPAHTGPLLDLAQFVVPTPAAPPSKEAYLQLLADGLDLVDAVKDIGTALHDQAKRALEQRRPRARLRALGRPRRAPLAR